jgi:alkanesulfonate monooxygenase SsuD/methylene tetrahydromethanopterin reductase-like flavin-dependent oxidoreductase (luciferase family)
MDTWYFTEQSYHPAWNKYAGNLRVDITGKYADPMVMSRLMNEYLDQYVLADQVGMNIMVNEHHTAATCLSISVTQMLAMLARQTKQARLLALGSIISNRPDPIRVAEEYALVDSISGGRLEMGFVKGAGWELFASNANPVGLMDRYWEAHDLILEAMTNPNEQFSWEGEYFNYRAVNLWPRPIQQPHPPIWVSSNSPGSAKAVAEKGYRLCSFLTGFAGKPIFDAYREAYQAKWGKPAPRDRMGYLGLLAIGKTKEEIERRVIEMRAYQQSVKRMNEAHLAPPGYGPAGDFARMLRSPMRGRMGIFPRPMPLPSGKMTGPEQTNEDLAEAGVMFWGEPQRVLDQILAFDENMGGFGHLAVMAQGAEMSHDDACDNIRLFAEHVMPHLQKLDKFAPSGRAVEPVG